MENEVMIFQPVVPWALVIVLILALLIFVVWQFIRSTSRQEKVSWVRRGLLVVLVGIMTVGPSIPGGKSPAGMLNLDVIFVVDTTTSMGAEDYDGDSTRMEGVRADIQNIAKNMTGARFSIITFDDEARVMLPMTTDQSSLSIVASQLVRESSIRSQGSSIDAALNATTQQLVANKKQNPQRPSVLFYLGDGEQTAKESPKSFAGLATYIQGGAVLGYGTAAGGKMKSYYGYGDETKCINNSFSSCYVVDNSTFNSISNNTPALSKIDENNLKKIAGEMRIPYENRNNGGDTQSLFDASKVDTLANSSREVTLYTNLYFIFAIPFVLLLLWELLYAVGKYRELSFAKPRSKS
jgi:Ca-activated chloride channel family protein